MHMLSSRAEQAQLDLLAFDVVNRRVHLPQLSTKLDYWASCLDLCFGEISAICPDECLFTQLNMLIMNSLFSFPLIIIHKSPDDLPSVLGFLLQVIQKSCKFCL